jgi:hypothetical protein
LPPPLDLAKGRLLRAYDFKGIGGIFLDPVSERLHVVDGVNDDVTPRRFLVRRFRLDGAFEAAVSLSRPDEKAPDGVDGFVFGQFPTPYFLHREDERLTLRRIFTATIVDVALTEFPGAVIPRVGLAALGVDGRVLTLAALRYDPEEKDAKTTNERDIVYFRAEPDNAPLVVHTLKDPLLPTRRLAVGPGGVTYLFGASREGRLVARRLDPSLELAEPDFGLTRMPDRVWVAPDGVLWLAYAGNGSEPARLARHAADGRKIDESPVLLESGARFVTIDGLAFPRAGGVLLAGTTLDAALKAGRGIYTF